MDKSFRNLAAFSGEVLVECWHCGKRAVVFAELGRYSVPYPINPEAKFRCNNCYKPLDDRLWFGPIVLLSENEKCKYCGNKFLVIGRVSKYEDKIEVKCSTCKPERKYRVDFRLTYANSMQATDPHFGLQLWLQIPIGRNLLWAYNFEHLAYIKNYVGAKLREVPKGGKYSLIWGLPDFIKNAKNRERVLKGISLLECKS